MSYSRSFDYGQHKTSQADIEQEVLNEPQKDLLLIDAASELNFPFMEAAIRHGASLTATAGDLRATALHHAIDSYKQDGKDHAVELLLRNGADPNACNAENDTPLTCACRRSNSYKTVRALLENGANPNLIGDGMYPIHVATFSGYSDIVRLLVEKGADVNMRSAGGSTALHQAVAPADKSSVYGYSHEPASPLDTAQVLLAAGADMDVTDAKGRTALDLAAQHSPQMLALLKSYIRPAELQKSADENFIRDAAKQGCFVLFAMGAFLVLALMFL
jgi:ankyrin repeat protein